MQLTLSAEGPGRRVNTACCSAIPPPGGALPSPPTAGDPLQSTGGTAALQQGPKVPTHGAEKRPEGWSAPERTCHACVAMPLTTGNTADPDKPAPPGGGSRGLGQAAAGSKGTACSQGASTHAPIQVSGHKSKRKQPTGHSGPACAQVKPLDACRATCRQPGLLPRQATRGRR